MIRHIVIAAWRNMMANRLISAIAIVGLAVGIAAALLMALVVRNQLTFDHFIPGHERTYRVFWWLDPQTTRCSEDFLECGPSPDTAAELQRYPAVESTARLFPAALSKVQHGAVTGWEHYSAVDPDFFAVVPLPSAYGHLTDALTQPDGAVITRAIARKYFGRDDAVGQELAIHGHKLAVRAVIQDLPRNATNIQTVIFVGWNDLRRIDATVRPPRRSHLYVRLKPGASLTDAQATEAMRRTPTLLRIKNAGQPQYSDPVLLLPLDRINLWDQFNPGIRLRLAAAALTGALVLLIAAINFVNLMVAQAARREKEVGVRKANGGGRFALMLQFLGEAVFRVAIAAVIGMALAEWLLPFVNAFLDTNAVLDWNDPLLLAALSSAIFLLALAVGFWPAFVLSGFRPAFVLRGVAGGRHAVLIRGTLVTLQFSILITLAIAGAIMWLQRDFAAREALRVDSDQMLMVKLGPVFPIFQLGSAVEQAEFRRQPFSARTRFCPPGFVDEVRKLSGVRGAACTDDWMIVGDRPAVAWETKSGALVLMQGYSVDPRLFALYGIRPLAGTLPQVTGSDDDVRATGTVINLAAMHKLGFASPQAALGRNWIGTVQDMSPETRKAEIDTYGAHAVITAVVPDFSFGSVRNAVPPTLYSPWPLVSGSMVYIKLSGRDIPETLAAIDRLYARSGIDAPLDRIFLGDYMQGLYRDVTRDANFFAGTAAIAILLACMGLMGIAVSTAERRTKEIGIRKAMGADNRQIVALLLWQFAQPVLWANVIAWPVAWWLMRRWLSGFAYHIDLHWWVFAAASAGALAVALLTVAGQAFLTARQKPVLALRTE